MKILFFTIITTLHLTILAQISSFNLVCPRNCSDEANSCDCYRDGFMDCAVKNLASVPANLHPCLTNLELRNNRITRINIMDFYGLHNATILSLSGNQLTELSAGIFSHLTNLKILDLEHNNIRRIEDCAFQGLSSLTKLDLNFNQIVIAEDRAFDGLSNLEDLSLISNQLTTLHVRWFEEKPYFRDTAIGNNTWNCNCNLKHNYTTIVNHFNQTVHCPVSQLPIFQYFNKMCILCQEPATLANQFLRNVSLSTFPACSSTTYSYTRTSQSKDGRDSTCSQKVDVLLQTAMMSETTDNPATTADYQRSRTTMQGERSISFSNTAQYNSMENSLSITTLPAWAVALMIIVALLLLAGGFLVMILVQRKNKKSHKAKTHHKSGEDSKFTNNSFKPDDKELSQI